MPFLLLLLLLVSFDSLLYLDPTFVEKLVMCRKNRLEGYASEVGSAGHFIRVGPPSQGSVAPRLVEELLPERVANFFFFLPFQCGEG